MEIREIPVKGPDYIGAVNTYIIGEEKLTLIDTGPNFAESFRDLVEGIEEQGLQPENLEKVVITHPHYDHFGNASRLRDEFGAEIIAHRNATSIIENHQGYIDGFRSFFSWYLSYHGMSEKETEEALQGLPDPDNISVAVQRAVEGGDRIELEKGSLKVIDSPGHAPGSISLSPRTEDVIFTGDNILKDITPNPMLQLPSKGRQPEDSLPEYIRTLKSFSSAESEGLPGHGGEIESVRKRADEIVTHHMDRKEEIFDRLDGETTAHQIMQEIFPEVSPQQYFYAISEVIGHLELLIREGRAELKDNDGYMYHRSEG